MADGRRQSETLIMYYLGSGSLISYRHTKLSFFKRKQNDTEDTKVTDFSFGCPENRLFELLWIFYQPQPQETAVGYFAHISTIYKYANKNKFVGGDSV